MNTEFNLLRAELRTDKNDWEGVRIALTALQKDIEMVSGTAPEISSDISKPTEMAIIAGTLGKSTFVEKLSGASGLKGKRESYIMEVVENAEGAKRALVIAGSDKRGTIYGIYKISEMIGVSPWVWWADSVPAKKDAVTVAGDYRFESREPSVKYRGFFTNDEAPSLSGWAGKHYGKLANPQASSGYDSAFYARIFELLLRLKGNYYWPTMWNNSFHTDDPKNTALADAYGVVMGTSHHEHMTCADKEWTWSNRGAWNYATNRDEIYKFWNEGVDKRQQYESIITLGMRGQADTSILGPDATLRDNMALLQGVINDQRKIITDVYGKGDAAPQMIALYKEVEDFYYGDGTGEKDGKLDVPEDVTLMLCDDNFGNIRTLPTDEMRKRSGGFGMYYHFDYRGGPISYEWINQTPLAKAWDNMTAAYDGGVRDIWIVNVGDLKPMELPLSYFMELAYDFEKWSAPNKTDEFTKAWAEREFGAEFAQDVMEILNGYTKILGARKAEVVLAEPSTFSLFAFDEADNVLSKFEDVVAKAEAIYEKLSSEKKPAFYQLALYPARAAMNTYKTHICAAWSLWLAKNNLPAANEYAKMAQAAFDADAADTEYFNKELSNGKWDGIMRQNHMGYTSWDGPKITVVPNDMPPTGTVTPTGSGIAIRVQNSNELMTSGSPAFLGMFTNLARKKRYIDIFDKGTEPTPFNVEANVEWLSIEKTSGVCESHTRIWVSVEWDKLPSDSSDLGASIKISCADEVFSVIPLISVLPQNFPSGTFVTAHDYVSINPAKFAKNTAAQGGQFEVVKNYGRDDCDSVKVLPNGASFEPNADAPTLEYNFYINTHEECNINVFLAPSNPSRNTTILPLEQQLRFSVQVNDGERKTVSGLPQGSFTPGHGVNWDFGVVNNARTISIPHGKLSEGLHTLKIFAVDAGVVIQKIVIAPASEKPQRLTYSPQTEHFMNSLFGPPESHFVS
ncbi:MAG: glycosyl hydrolase 115 family protein [Defluviitaleaceae bacterium]|nr:glycosyl hydrolase 115 family protein [Defluviitaleaceae bacterium]